MSKVDDMRRQREERFAESARRAASAPKRVAVVVPLEGAKAPVAVAALDDDVEPAQPTRSTSSSGAGNEEARCPECGKTKPLQNGVMASHQQGFGKQCAGSRKKPEPTD